MDVVNTIENIKIKMKSQMRTHKGIYGLNEVFFFLAKIDKTGEGLLQKIKLDEAFGKLGIFLTTQEQSQLCKYIGINPGEQISLEKFTNIFRDEVPIKLIESVTDTFEIIKGENESINVDYLKSIINIKKHPLVKIFHKSEDYAQRKLDLAIKFVLMDKPYMDLADFIEIHKNMFYTMPKENVNYFIKFLPEIWGIKVNDF